jgi:hypothetical protein
MYLAGQLPGRGQVHVDDRYIVGRLGQLYCTCTLLHLVTSYLSLLLHFGSIFEAHKYVVALAIRFNPA